MTALNTIIIAKIKQHLWGLLAILGLMLLYTSSQILSPWPFKLLLDNVLGDESLDPSTFIGKFVLSFSSTSNLGMMVIASFFLVSLITNLLEYVLAIYSAKIGQAITSAFSQEAFDKVVTLDIGFFRTQDIGDYIYRISYDVQALEEFLKEGVLPIISSTLYLIVIVFVLISMDPNLAFYSLLILPLLSFSLILFNKRIVRATEQSEKYNSLLYTYVEQVLTQLKIIQAYAQEKNKKEGFFRQLMFSQNAEYSVSRLNILLSLFLGMVIGVSYTFIVGIGIYLVTIGTISTGILIVFIYYLDTLTQPMVDVIYSVSTLKETYTRMANMEVLFDPENHIHDTGVVTKLSDIVVSYQDVCLESDEGKPILSHVTCRIKPGSITAILGHSGSGKSTLTSLLMRLVDNPQSGKIMIGENDVREYTLETLRKSIAYVPQDITLFNEPIASLIRFGNTEATLEEVKNAARQAVADGFIMDRKHGYFSKAGKGGAFLSGGQRKRILLARAYLTRAPIMILDEVFASQDEETAIAIMENLREYAKEHVVIIITHQTNMLRENDHAIVINEGKIMMETDVKGAQVTSI